MKHESPIVRRKSRQIMVGNVPVGGDAPIAVQSMTATHTTDIDATVAQVNALYEAGEAEYRLAHVIRLLSWRQNETSFTVDATNFLQCFEALNQRVASSQAGAGKRRQRNASAWLPLIRECLDDLG